MTAYGVCRYLRGLVALSCLVGCMANALAATPEQVAAECTRQMSLGICMTKVDRGSVTPGQTMLLSGVGRVSYATYLDYVDLNNPKAPSDPAMCQLALRHMTQSPGSDHDKIARALWTPVAEPPLVPSSNGLLTGWMWPRALSIGAILLAMVVVWQWRRK